jgi:hypothetical protein
MSEETPASAARRLFGLRRALGRASPSLVKSTYGGPLAALTRRTTDPPDQDKCRPLPHSGNTTSIEVLPTAATTSAVWMSEPTRLPQEIAGTKINSVRPNHP